MATLKLVRVSKWGLLRLWDAVPQRQRLAPNGQVVSAEQGPWNGDDWAACTELLKLLGKRRLSAHVDVDAALKPFRASEKELEALRETDRVAFDEKRIGMEESFIDAISTGPAFVEPDVELKLSRASLEWAKRRVETLEMAHQFAVARGVLMAALASATDTEVS